MSLYNATSALALMLSQTALSTLMQVNSQLQTSNPDVYAAGDIAAFPLTMYGGKVTRQEHVVNARLVQVHLPILS